MAQTTHTYKEAKRLHRLGFAVHWLHQKSKRPIESGWTTGPRKTWDYLKETYVEGLNVGVRLGTPSKIGDNFLAVIDVDVKSTTDAHRKEAIRAAKKIIQGAACPVVRSGRGNGSRHYYCVTAEPFKGFDAVTSEDVVKVFMPSARPSKRETAELTEAEINEGMRLRPAWEISIMSEGRQVVLPPSIHPDSNEPYTWAVHVADVDSFPVLDFSHIEREEKSEPAQASSNKRENLTVEDFEVVPVELEWLPISDRVRENILTGENVDDRSAYLLTAATALFSAGLTKNEILSVLTDSETFLGSCAFEHAKTTSRKRAAQWVWKYTVHKVFEERSAEIVFAKAAKITPNTRLDEDGEKAQTEELNAESDWRDYFEKTEKGKNRNTLNNCKLILQNVCGTPNIVGRNDFAAQDFFLVETPWRSRKGDEVRDVDIVRIKFYCAERFRIEFSSNTINEALIEIADLNRFHPVRDYLNSLEWDGTPRIDTWLKDYAGATAPEPYLSEVSRKFLVAMVKRVFEPGCKFDQVLILEGLQGSGKSSLARALSEPWFSDATLNIGDKDAILTMQSKWLIELGELSALGKADLEILKAFITQTSDRIRAPYGKRVEEFPRQSVFLGTTNLDEYLRDLTGNRRFWPVKVTSPDWEKLREDRDQLFAEAVAFYRLDEPLYLDNEAIVSQATIEQTKRSSGDEWVSIVLDILKGPAFPITQFEMRDVAKRMDQVGAHRLTPTDVQRLTRCFKLIGCESWRESSGGRRRLWKVSPELLGLDDDGDNFEESFGEFDDEALAERTHGPKSKFSAVHRRPSSVQGSTDEKTPMETEF